MMSARVRGTAPCAWSTVSYMVSLFRFGGGMRSRPRRVHSRLGGAAVISLLARELGISSASIVEACWKWLLCPSTVGNKAIFSRP